MIKLTPGFLTLPQLRRIARGSDSLELDPASFAAIDASAKAVADIAAKGEPAYGINTGFGRLASTHIPADQLELLQRNLVLSHAVGVGEPMSRPVVRLLIALKLSSLGARPFGHPPRSDRCARHAVQRRRPAGDPGEGLGRRIGRSRAARASCRRCCSASAR